MGHEAVANAAQQAAQTRGLAIAAYRLAANLHNRTRIALLVLIVAQVGTWLYLAFRG